MLSISPGLYAPAVKLCVLLSETFGGCLSPMFQFLALTHSSLFIRIASFFLFSIFSSCEYNTATKSYTELPKNTLFSTLCLCVDDVGSLYEMRIFLLAARMLTIMCGGRTFFWGWMILTWYTIFFSYYISFIHFFPLPWTMYWEQATGVNKKRNFCYRVCQDSLFSLECYKFFFSFQSKKRSFRGKNSWSDCPLFNYLGHVIKRGECLSSTSHFVWTFFSEAFLCK